MQSKVIKDGLGRDIPAPWIRLTQEERLEKANILLKRECEKFGLQTDVQVTSIKDNHRFVIYYKQDPTKPMFGWKMMAMEKELRNVLGFGVELQFESLDDKNRREKRSGR